MSLTRSIRPTAPTEASRSGVRNVPSSSNTTQNCRPCGGGASVSPLTMTCFERISTTSPGIAISRFTYGVRVWIGPPSGG